LQLVLATVLPPSVRQIDDMALHLKQPDLGHPINEVLEYFMIAGEFTFDKNDALEGKKQRSFIVRRSRREEIYAQDIYRSQVNPGDASTNSTIDDMSTLISEQLRDDIIKTIKSQIKKDEADLK